MLGFEYLELGGKVINGRETGKFFCKAESKFIINMQVSTLRNFQQGGTRTFAIFQAGFEERNSLLVLLSLLRQPLDLRLLLQHQRPHVFMQLTGVLCNAYGWLVGNLKSGGLAAKLKKQVLVLGNFKFPPRIYSRLYI